MKNIQKILFVLVITFVLFVSCQNEDSSGASGEAAAGDAIALAEKYLMEENENLPDFNTPQVEDSSVKVDGLPEEVVWMTSKPKPLGSKHAKKGGTFNSYVTSFPLTFRYIGPDSNGVGRQFVWDAVVFGPLSWNDETQQFMPGLATHWAVSKDKKTVYFKLNEKAKWSDGEPVTSDDFVFTIEFMTSKNTADPWYQDYYGKLKVTPYSDHVFSITYFKEVDDPRDLLGSVGIKPTPRHFYKEHGGKVPENWVELYNWKVQPVTGPYVITNWKKGEYFELERVRPWWGDDLPQYQGYANIDKLHYKVVTGGLDIGKELFFKGEIDTQGAVIPQMWRDFAGNEKVINGYIDRWVAKYVPLNGMVGMFLNAKHPLFSKKEVRQALYYGLDMQGMIDNVLFGEYARQHSLGVGQTIYGVDFNNHDIKKPAFDPAKAKELLAKAGYDKIGPDGIAVNANGEKVSFDLLYAWKHHTERISYLVEQAKKAGIHIEMKLQTGDSAWQAFTTHKYQAYWGGYNARRAPDYWEFLHSDQVNQGAANAVFGWSSPETDKLTLVNREGGLSYEEKAENNKKIEAIMHEEALFHPTYYVAYNRYLAWKWIRFPGWLNMKYNDGFADPFTYMWIDEDIKKEVLKAMEDGNTYEPKIWELSERYNQD